MPPWFLIPSGQGLDEQNEAAVLRGGGARTRGFELWGLRLAVDAVADALIVIGAANEGGTEPPTDPEELTIVEFRGLLSDCK